MSDAFALTGTRQREPEPVRLEASPLSADLVNGNLRTIRYGGAEILRAIAYIVRDRDWGTYEPTLSGFSHEQRDGSFTVAYEAMCVGPGGATLRFATRIEATGDGLSFSVTATPDTDFETNRCGFCILHPIVGIAGSPVRVEHTDGSIEETVLPELVDPWQPFMDMRAITHRVGDVSVECRMEGDTFEMEDQRNWSDASYKTYVRPLALPWPYVLPGGEPQAQTITLRFSGVSKPVNVGTAGILRPTLGDAGLPLPAMGFVVYPQDVAATMEHLDLLRELAPQALLLHFDPVAGHGAAEMHALGNIARAHPASITLECALPCRDDLDREMGSIAALARDAGLAPDAIVVSPSVDRQSTPPGSKWPDCPPLDEVYAAARRAFPSARLGGGMLSYFTELNRKRVPADQLDFITHCTNPIVHASDDLSVMQSLEALPFITRSVRAIYGAKPYRIGPSTIPMRQNPYGSATKQNLDMLRIAMADRDPRHNALLAAAWAVGYAARVASAGLDQLVLSALAGPFGLIAGEGEPVAEGGRRPLFHVVKALAAMAGLSSIHTDAVDDTRLAILAARSSSGKATGLAANLTPATVSVDIAALCEDSPLAILDANSITAAEGWRPLGRTQAIDLPPYAVLRFG